ncbi:hypothetical protein TSUD_125910 [Trifolium subterraneum]|uniref:Rab3 GTPase-activating protein catalytic subunit n=2 Tax=Trifolium TaxID=3898 RepID=A0A2Z6MVA8_TRISU|nr:hypothetical protein TSUD_125910 [Trifolium subterraneum]
MASSSGTGNKILADSTDEEHTEVEEDEEEEETLEHFDDFTLASSWERFISEIEGVCRLWMSDGPKNLLVKGAVLLEDSDNLYKVIAPQSASGVVLDAPEASKLLSAVAIALSNCSSLWPAFVRVHDPSRKAYIGIQSMGTVFTRRFEADRIGSQAYSTLDLSVHNFKVRIAMKLTFRTLPFDEDYMKDFDAKFTKSGENLTGESETSNGTQWDDDCSWSEWYSAEDPVKDQRVDRKSITSCGMSGGSILWCGGSIGQLGFELITIWSEKMVESSMEMAELENASPHEAEKWLVALRPEGSKESRVGFASQLHLLVDALQMSFEAHFIEDFVSAAENPGSDNLKSSMVIPSPTVRDRVLKELFIEGVQFSGFSEGGDKTTPRTVKGAPLESLFAQFCLHSLWFGNCNIRAISVLWIEFVREVRWCWEESQPLPRMPPHGSIDLTTCLINQKLQMLAICIERKCQLNEDYQDCIGSVDHIDSMSEEESVVGDDVSNIQPPSENISGKVDRKPEGADLFNDKKSSDFSRRGSAGIVDSMMLIKSHQSMHAPYTQEPPLMTEDMHEERMQAVEAFGDSFLPTNFSQSIDTGIGVEWYELSVPVMPKPLNFLV